MNHNIILISWIPSYYNRIEMRENKVEKEEIEVRQREKWIGRGRKVKRGQRGTGTRN